MEQTVELCCPQCGWKSDAGASVCPKCIRSVDVPCVHQGGVRQTCEHEPSLSLLVIDPVGREPKDSACIGSRNLVITLSLLKLKISPKCPK